MKLLDYLITASFVGCMFVGYSGHRLIALLLLLLIVTVASWRFWDRHRERDLAQTGSSGELNPELDDVSHTHDPGDVGGSDHG
ncbi:MAG: hypothetical protein J0M24_16740 [Verrucomicrobia bacterium]|nr:hypothetical protein [Verrucomicrobiota bacterium]